MEYYPEPTVNASPQAVKPVDIDLQVVCWHMKFESIPPFPCATTGLRMGER